jgi:anti-sigma factor (TIGR02949 family)
MTASFFCKSVSKYIGAKTKMDCLKMRKNISKYLDGELTKDEVSELLNHLGICPDCNREYEEMKMLLDSIKAPAEVFAPPHLFASIRQRIYVQEHQPILLKLLKPILVPVVYSLLLITAIFISNSLSRNFLSANTQNKEAFKLTLNLTAFDDAPRNSFSNIYDNLMSGE